MYFDNKPCQVCGSEVKLQAREVPDASGSEPVGAPDGVVGDADPTVDERVCSNSDCPSHEEGGPTS